MRGLRSPPPPRGGAKQAAWRAAALSLALATLGGCASTGPAPSAVADGPVCARIFSTNDTHGRLLPAVQSWSGDRLVGGSAALAGYVAEARLADPDCPLFVVSGGDMMQGTLISNLTGGRSTIDAMNAIGYDAAAIGNHEFDWGVDVLVERVGQADFAMLGANIYMKGTGRHPDWARPWAIVERDGVRIGFIGMTTRSTPVTTRPINVVDFEFRSIAEALDRYIPVVREQGVDFVVAVMHEGGFCDGGDGSVCEGDALTELRATREPFDYAVTGHTHSRIDTRIGGAPVIQSFSNSTAFGLGRMEREADGTVQAETHGIRRAYADEIEADLEVEALVRDYGIELEDLVRRVVTTLPEPLAAPRRGDFPLGRIVADAQRHESGARIALMNNGGIRRPLPAGDITYAELFELQPFGNTLIQLTMTGAGLLEALERSAQDDGADLHVSGITVRYDPSAPYGSRIRSVEVDDGSLVQPDGRYAVTVNDFLATGGGGYTMFLEADAAEPVGLVDLDALVAYLERQPRPLPLPREARWVESAGR